MPLASQTKTGRNLLLDIDRRGEPRSAADVRARVKSLDPVTSTGPSTIARIVGTSRHGLMLRAPRPFMAGATLQVLAENRIYLGKVRYCLSVDAEFYIGVRLEPNDT